MGRRVHVEADDIFDLFGEGRIIGPFEGADAMRLEAVHVPNALDSAQRQADRLGHGAAGPMGCLAGRLALGQCQHLGDSRGRHRRPAGRPGFVAQQPIHSGFGIAYLPAPHRRAARAGAARHLQHRQAVRRK